MFRIGVGNDIHRLIEGRKLMIGGIEIPSDKGAEGHSDGDVLLHAITDAILGALALGDIGKHFPDTDLRWKNAESKKFLSESMRLMKDKGFRVANLDSTISLEKPKLRDKIDEIRNHIAQLLEVEDENVSVKAKTNEGLDAIGEGRAISATAVVLLSRI